MKSRVLVVGKDVHYVEGARRHHKVFGLEEVFPTMTRILSISEFECLGNVGGMNIWMFP